MSKFTEHMFFSKDAYAFGKLEKKSFGERLPHELNYQLQNLEEHWVKLRKWQEFHSFKEEIKYQRLLERICFRLEEIDRFLKENKGPPIIRFVCGEIQDLMREQQLTESYLSQEIAEQVGIILTVMISYFLTSVADLHLITLEELAERLQEKVEQLMNRYTGKSREESLRSLSKKVADYKKKQGT